MRGRIGRVPEFREVGREFRSPKSEIRKKSEIRNPKFAKTGRLAIESYLHLASARGRKPLKHRHPRAFRASSFGFLSDFGSRISDLGHRYAYPHRARVKSSS